MKVNQLLDKIIDKWPVKICCLVVAISLYLFHQASLVDRKSFVIPLQIQESGAVMHIGDYANTVNVVVRANPESITAVHGSQISAYVNLNNISKEGEYTVPVIVKVADEIKGFDPFEVKVTPENIKIKVENKVLKAVPLEIAVGGEPYHGYELVETKITPSHVQIMGPESLVENTHIINTDLVSISDLRESKEFDVKYKNLNKLINIETPNSFKVSVQIKPKEMSRIISDIPVNITGLSNKLLLTNKISPVTVRLNGTVPNLENYTPSKNFVSIDLQKITEEGEYDLPMIFNIPSYLKMDELKENTVHVSILAIPEEVTPIEDILDSGIVE